MPTTDKPSPGFAFPYPAPRAPECDNPLDRNLALAQRLSLIHI